MTFLRLLVPAAFSAEAESLFSTWQRERTTLIAPALLTYEVLSALRRYVHLGTGNYNPITARIYTDIGLFTINPEFGADVSELFNFLTGFSGQTHYRKLLVAPWVWIGPSRGLSAIR